MAESSEIHTSGRLALITGASSGIGRALAVALARDGWRVVVSSRRQEALEAIATDHPDIAGRFYPRVADVTDRSQLAAMVAAIESDVGPLDTVVLNAGAYDPVLLDDLDAGRFAHTMEVNFTGTMNGLAAAFPHLRARGRGQILVTASVAAYRGLPKASAYGASKAAVLNAFEALKPEADATGVSLRVINPGFVETELTAKNDFKMPQLITPEQAASYIHREIDSSGFEILFPKRFGWVMKALRLLPYRLYFALTRRMIQ